MESEGPLLAHAVNSHVASGQSETRLRLGLDPAERALNRATRRSEAYDTMKSKMRPVDPKYAGP